MRYGSEIDVMWPQSSGLSRSFLSLPCPLKLHHRGRERPLKRMALQWRDLQRSRPLLCGCSARRLQASDVAPEESGRQASSELRLVERGSRSAGVAKDQDQRSLLLTPTPPRARDPLLVITSASLVVTSALLVVTRS